MGTYQSKERRENTKIIPTYTRIPSKWGGFKLSKNFYEEGTERVSSRKNRLDASTLMRVLGEEPGETFQRTILKQLSQINEKSTKRRDATEFKLHTEQAKEKFAYMGKKNLGNNKPRTPDNLHRQSKKNTGSCEG